MTKHSEIHVSGKRKKGEASILSTAHGHRASCWERMQESVCLESIWVTICIREMGKKGSIHQPLYSKWWVADVMLRKEAEKLMLGKYLSDKQIPWRWRRRLGMAVAGITPTASQLTKIGKSNQKSDDVGCKLSEGGVGARSPRWEHSQPGGRNIRSTQHCKLAPAKR